MFTVYQSLKRAGFASDYARVVHLTHVGEFRTMLDPGSIPDNKNLPPFMRLDQRSHLDNEMTKIAFPPVLDLTIQDKDVMKTLPSLADDVKEIKITTPFVKQTGLFIPTTRYARHVTRRLGPTEAEKKEKGIHWEEDL
jgi:hypothetical protein